MTLNMNEPTKKSWIQELSSITLSDFKLENIVKIPCAPKSLVQLSSFLFEQIYGILSATTLGSVRFMVSRNFLKSSRLALIAFSIVSVASFELCLMQRQVMLEQIQQMNQLEKNNSEPLQSTEK